MAGFLATGPAAPSIVTIQAKTSFTTTGFTIGTSETSITIPVQTKSFTIKTADTSSAELTISSVLGGTSSSLTSFDIPAGGVWKEEYLTGTSSITVYIKSSKTGTPVQVLYWT